ncbi:hypothetical protein [Paenibacillus medicaginis]|uniref:Uncharacterized protein n=1 Tax=Paenibacillus medicaginis TaxID=1470560 RepID=A0ABV5BXP2_9BACL
MNRYFRTWQDDYYDGVDLDDEVVNDRDLERDDYLEFINDTSDDHYIWLKNNAQRLYYREPFKPIHSVTKEFIHNK